MQYAIIALAVGIVLYFLQKSSAKTLDAQSLQGELRLVGIYRYIGIGGILMGIGLTVGVALSDEESKWLLAPLFLLLFGIPSTMLLMSYRNIWFRFNEDAISGSNLFGKTSSMKWSEVRSVKFSSFSSSFIFKDQTGQKLKLHMHTTGIRQVLLKMEEKTEFRAKEAGYNVPLHK